MTTATANQSHWFAIAKGTPCYPRGFVGTDLNLVRASVGRDLMPDEYRCFLSRDEASVFHSNEVVPRTDLQRMSTVGASAVLAAMPAGSPTPPPGASGGLMRTPSQSRRAPTPQAMSATPEPPLLDSSSHHHHHHALSRTPSPSPTQMLQPQPRALTPKPDLHPVVAEAMRTMPTIEDMSSDSAVREHEKFLLSRQKQPSVHGKRKQAGQQESARSRTASAKKLPPPQPPVVVAPTVAAVVVKPEPLHSAAPSAILPAKLATGILLSKERQKQEEATLEMLTASDATMADSRGQPTLPLGSVLQNLWASSSQFMTSQLNMVLQSTTAICIGALAFDKQRRMVAVPGLASTYQAAAGACGGGAKPRPHDVTKALSPPPDEYTMTDVAADTDGDELLAQQQQQQQLTWVRANERYGFVYGFYPGPGMLDGQAAGRKPSKQGVKASDVAKFRGAYAGTYLQALLTATLAGLRSHRTGRAFTILCAHQPFVDMMTCDWKAWQELLTPQPPAHLAYLAPLTPLLTQLQVETTDRRVSFEFREERMESLAQVMQVLREMSPMPPPAAHVPSAVRASPLAAAAEKAAGVASSNLRRTASEATNGSKFTDLSALWQNSLSNQLHHCFVYDERSLDITSDAPSGETVLAETPFIVEPRWWNAMKQSLATPLLVVSPVEHSVVRVRWMFDVAAPSAESGDRDAAYVLCSKHARGDFVPTTEEDRLLVAYVKHREAGLAVDAPGRQRQLVVFTRDVWIPEVNFGRDRVAREQTRLRYGCYLWALICVLRKCPAFVTKLRIRLQSRVLLEHGPALAASMLTTKLAPDDYQKHTHWLWARLRVLLSNRKVEMTEDTLSPQTSSQSLPSPASMDHVRYDAIANACQATRTSLTAAVQV